MSTTVGGTRIGTTFPWSRQLPESVVVDTLLAVCTERHPFLNAVCARVECDGRHEGMFGRRRIAWEPNAITETPTAARSSDPEASHQFAKAGFGAKGLRRRILNVATADWQTCEQIAVAIFGPGPFDMDQVRQINKVWTMSLNLYRGGLLDRLKGKPLAYRRKT